MLTWLLCLFMPQADWCSPTIELTGFVDSETISVHSPASAKITKILVSKGQVVKPDQQLAQLDTTLIDIQLNENKAQLQSAQASLDDQKKPYTEVEVETARLTIQAAKIKQQQAQAELNRFKKLDISGGASQKQIQDLEFSVQQAETQVAIATSRLEQLTTAIRPKQLEIQQTRVTLAQQALKKTQWLKQQQTIVSHQNAWVQSLLAQTGDFVTQGQPLMTLLLNKPNLVFYWPGNLIGQSKVGDTIFVVCKRCKNGLAEATISYRALKPEFSPPEVYTKTQFSKYVYYTEATWNRAEDAGYFSPGEPLTVQLTPRAKRD